MFGRVGIGSHCELGEGEGTGCNGQWEGSVCGSWEKGSHLGNRGARPARMGKRPAVGSIQRRRRDIATWPLVQETGSLWLQDSVMHRVSAFVHCTAVIQYNHNKNCVSLYYWFQENKSFGTYYHLHSSSNVRDVVSSKIYFLFATNHKRPMDNEMRMTA